MSLRHFQVKLLLDEAQIAFLSEEVDRRNAEPIDVKWKLRELAAVRASILLSDWITDQKAKLALPVEDGDAVGKKRTP